MVESYSKYIYHTISLLVHILAFLVFFIPHDQENYVSRKKNTININIGLLNEKINPKIASNVSKEKIIQIYEKAEVKNINNKKLNYEKEIIGLEKYTENKPLKAVNKTKNEKQLKIAEENLNNKKNIQKANADYSEGKESISFEKYNAYLKKTIQLEASKSYPKSSIRKNEQGKVELIFSLRSDGSLKKLVIGKNTEATNRLVKSAKNSLEKLSPFKKDTILKDENVFSIVIIYKLN